MPTTTDQRLIADDTDRRQAQDLLAALDGDVERLVVPEGDTSTKAIPRDLARIIGKVLQIMADGGTVTIGSMPDELSTTVAAKQLGVSRPTLMKMIHNGEIPAHKVGSHHRIKAADVRAAKRERLARQRQAFEELRRLEDELGTF